MSSGSWRQKKATRRRAAIAQVADLGELVPVEPARRGGDGSPQAGRGQVYVTPAGQAFHRVWCPSVGRQWDEHPDKLLVIDETTVGGRRECRDCSPV